jgi:aminopeptidase-like protein
MIKDLVAKLYPYAYSVTGEGNDLAIPAFCSELPFVVHEFQSGRELNGWIVAPAWRVQKALIKRDGKVVYDGTSSPLGVITLSQSFAGRVNLDTLKQHLYFSADCPDAIVYHWTALYRPQERSWGFCVPRTLWERLEEGFYDVELITEEASGTMKVLDYLLPGESSETILLNAHNCHPYQANDDISGCAVGIRVMQALAKQPRRRYSYRLVVAPELIGTAFWLDSLGESAANLRYAVMLKSVGNAAPLKLQESYAGMSKIDIAAHRVFTTKFRDYVSGAFRTIYGNDETVFEAPGYEIPSISLTRYPFVGYHTSQDTPDSLDEATLEDTLHTVMSLLEVMEKNVTLKFVVKGLVALSHPRYDLYRAAPAPGIGRREYAAINARWNLLMNCLPRELDGKRSLLEIADKYELPFDELHEYVMRWVDKGLVSSVRECC